MSTVNDKGNHASRRRKADKVAPANKRRVASQKFTETNDQLARVISERFSVSLMNNTKWERLIDEVAHRFEDGIWVKYKLIHTDAVHQTRFLASDCPSPFFLEPILYKEVEWIEFPHEYEDFVRSNNRKAGTKIYRQDVPAICRDIERLGKFEIEYRSDGLRLYAYK